MNESSSTKTVYPKGHFTPIMYKHLKPEHADLMMNEGQVLVSNLYSYRNAENEAIKDWTEGAKLQLLSRSMGDLYVMKNGVKEKYDNKGLIQFGPTAFFRPINYPDCFSYCLSLVDNQIFSNYNACIKISDIKGLIGHISLGLRRSQECVLQPPVGSRVMYIKGKEVSRHDKIPAYWIKDKKFESEQEYRIIFRPEHPSRLAPVILKIKNIHKFCERIR